MRMTVRDLFISCSNISTKTKFNIWESDGDEPLYYGNYDDMPIKVRDMLISWFNFVGDEIIIGLC